jgi:hypothetical protein
MVGLHHDADAAARAAESYLASGTFRHAHPRFLKEDGAKGLGGLAKQ